MPEPTSPTAFRWREYARLTRFEYAGLCLAPLYGALTIRGAHMGAAMAAELCAIHLFYMIWANAHNELTDLPWDSRSPLAAGRSLASGRITRRQAWLVVGVGAGISALLVAVFFPRPLAMAVLALSWGCGALYNQLGKRILGSDVFYAASLALACLFGALASAPEAGLRNLPSFTWIMTGIIFANQFYFNAVPGGLKDLAYDRASGVRTLAVRFSRIGPGGLRMTPAFAGLALGLRAAAIALAVIYLISSSSPAWQVGLLIPAFAVILMVAVAVGAVPGLSRGLTERFSKWGEVASVIMLALLFLNAAGWGWAIVLVGAPALWFMLFNYLVHGKIIKLPRS